MSTAEDGSEFMLLCNRDFAPFPLGGVSSFQITDFDSCMELCADQGTACAGITFGGFGGPFEGCRLQRSMLPWSTYTDGIASAVRIGGSGVRLQPLQNSAFDNTLSPWVSGTTTSGQAFELHDNAARVLIDLAAPGPPRLKARRDFRDDGLTISQEFAQPVTGNNAYYMSFDVGFDVAPGDVQCQIYVTNGMGDLFSNLALNAVNGVSTIYGSGTIGSGFTPRIVINVVCMGSTDVMVTLDNIIFDLYPPSSGSPTVCDRNRQVIQNSNFNSGLDFWLFSQGESSSASFSYFGDRARVAFDASRTSQDDPAVVSQTAFAVESGTTYSAYVDVYFTVAPSGSCSLDLRSDVESISYTGQVFQSGWFPITVQGTFETEVHALVLRIDCLPGNSLVEFDNVYLYLNPGPDCPPNSGGPPGPIVPSETTSTSSEEASSSTTEEPTSSTSSDEVTSTSSSSSPEETSSTTTEEPTSSKSSEEASSTTSDESSTTSSTTPTPTAPPKPQCPIEGSRTYINEDGSSYVIVCDQEYAGNNMAGISQITAADFGACVDICMYQGTSCQGVSYVEDNSNCFLKTRMIPTAYTGITIHSAVRVNGPMPGPPSTQLLINGDFANDLSSWEPDMSGTTAVSWRDGVA